jgi:hypothetical protein
MSVIFQLFHAEDLKQLTPEQLEALKQTIRQAVKDSQDTLLNASLAVSNLIHRRHMQKLLPEYASPTLGSPPSRVNISRWSSTEVQQGALNRLMERVREVFHQLTGAWPSGPSSPPSSPTLLPEELLNQLLSQADLDTLTATAGPTGHKILAWALTCELANFNTYDAFERVRQRAEETFIRFMKEQGKGEQRPKGPDTPYSPFYPGNALYPHRGGSNP